MTTVSGSSPLPAVRTPLIAYRGTRTYVHSTDLYLELMAAARELGVASSSPVDLRLKRAITTQIELHFDGEAESAEAGAAPARFTIGPVFGRILAANRPVTNRKPYDERRIWDRARIDGRVVKMSADSGAAPIEVVTALGVLLHNVALKPPEGSRWLLSRLTLSRPLGPDDAIDMTVAITHAIGRTMTRSSLTAGDGPLGSMDFIVGTAPPAPSTGV